MVNPLNINLTTATPTNRVCTLYYDSHPPQDTLVSCKIESVPKQVD